MEDGITGEESKIGTPCAVSCSGSCEMAAFLFAAKAMGVSGNEVEIPRCEAPSTPFSIGPKRGGSIVEAAAEEKIAAFPFIFSLHHKQEAVALRTDAKQILPACETVVLAAIIEARFRAPPLAAVFIMQAHRREGVGANGKIGGEGGEETARTVREEGCRLRSEVIFSRISDAGENAVGGAFGGVLPS